MRTSDSDVFDPVIPSAPFVRSLSFGAAAASFAILLSILQIGATDVDLKIAVALAAAGIPVAIASGVLCDVIQLIRRPMIRLMAGNRIRRTIEAISGSALIVPVIAMGFLIHHLEPIAAIPYVVIALGLYVYLRYSVWNLTLLDEIEFERELEREREQMQEQKKQGNA